MSNFYPTTIGLLNKYKSVRRIYLIIQVMIEHLDIHMYLHLLDISLPKG